MATVIYREVFSLFYHSSTMQANPDNLRPFRRRLRAMRRVIMEEDAQEMGARQLRFEDDPAPIIVVPSWAPRTPAKVIEARKVYSP